MENDAEYWSQLKKFAVDFPTVINILESDAEENIAFKKNIFEKFLKKILTQ